MDEEEGIITLPEGHRYAMFGGGDDYPSELLTTYSLRKSKWELLGKTVLLLATIVYQARRVVPTLKDVQSANINRLILALMSRS